MSFTITRINKEQVAPVKFIDVKDDPRPIAGASLFPEIYGNIFFCARKKSGKSCGIYHTIKHCATKETTVVAFCATINRDPTWASIQQLCKEMGVTFSGYTSIWEGKDDILKAIVESLEVPQEKEEKEAEQKGGGSILVCTAEDLPTSRGGKKKAKKPKFRAPEIIFCFDDIGSELQTPSLTSLMKKNRNLKSKVIVSSQNWNDLALQARKQLDYVLIFKGFSKSLDKLKEIYNNLDVSVSFEDFLAMYRFATSEKYHFLYIDVVNSEFRRDFSHKITPPNDDEQDL